MSKKPNKSSFIQLYTMKLFADLAITALKPAPVPVNDLYKTPKSELCYIAVSTCQRVFWFEDTTSAVVSCN